MSALSKLVQWLPKAVGASADDVATLGPQAGRVRSLLRFLPSMSDEAKSIGDAARTRRSMQGLEDDAWDEAISKAMGQGRGSAQDIARRWALDPPSLGFSAEKAALAESVSDIISPQSYRLLTNQLNTSRVVDRLRNKPRYQDTPLSDILEQFASRGLITGPRDVVRAGRVARSPEDVREIALTLIAEGMDPASALRAARLL